MEEEFLRQGLTEKYIKDLQERYKVKIRLTGYNIFISTDTDIFYLDTETFILYHEGDTKGKLTRVLPWVCKLASEHRHYILNDKKSKELKHIQRMKKLFEKI